MKILIIDAQGGGMGRQLVTSVKRIPAGRDRRCRDKFPGGIQHAESGRGLCGHGRECGSCGL